MKFQPLLLVTSISALALVSCIPIDDPNYFSSRPGPRPPLRDSYNGAAQNFQNSAQGYSNNYVPPNNNGYQQPQQGYSSNNALPQATGNANYPYATRSSENPNYVVSPYPPHNTIDISGYNPGQIVKEPGTTRIFRVPNY